jgi:hypothetical protein
LVSAKYFPYSSLRSISEYGTPKPSRSDDPEFWIIVRFFDFHQLHPKKVVLKPFAILFHESELMGLPQPELLWETLGHRLQ